MNTMELIGEQLQTKWYLSYLNLLRKTFFLMFESLKKNNALFHNNEKTSKLFILWIKDILDSGDIIFLKYECNECLTLRSIILIHLLYLNLKLKGMWDCNILQLNNSSDEEYDNLGIAFRNSEEELLIIYQDFNEIKVKEKKFINQSNKQRFRSMQISFLYHF